VFGLFGLLCVISIWTFAFGAFLGVLAVGLSAVALTERPRRYARGAALVGLASGSLALVGAAVLVALWLMGL
jgi:hypothetical protein